MAQNNGAGRAQPLCTLNDLLWFLYLYPLRALASVAPPSLLYAIGKLADPVVQFQQRRACRRAVNWIVSALGCTPVHARRIARRSITNNMYRILDDLLLLRPKGDTLRCSGMDGVQHLDQAIARGRGAILISGHFCAAQIAEVFLPGKGYPVLSLHNANPPNRLGGRIGTRMLQPRYLEMQRRANPDVIYMQDPDCTLKILQRLRSGGLVHIKPDGIAGASGLDSLLLGRPRRFPTGIFDLARLSGCAVVPMLCLGRARQFHVRFFPALELTAAASSGDFVTLNLPAVIATLEAQVTQHPEQWRLWTLISGVE